MKEVESPDIFIDFGLISLVSAALQRRVWYPFGTVNCYCNTFVILTGPPAIGKGRVITQVSDLLKYHKRQKGMDINITQLAEDEFIKVLSEATVAEEKQLFPTLPDSTSLRSLTNHIAASYFPVKQFIDGKPVPYGHCSSAFVLEELFDLFHEQKETIDIARFLTRAWDCGNFKHSTFNNGKDEIKKMCVTLLAGTTPEFMRKVFSSEMMNEGFASRTIFVWAEKNRFYNFGMGELDENQKIAKLNILDHLKALSTLCGPLTLEPAAYGYLKDWYEHKQHLPAYRTNHNYKLDYYYGRKKMHILKLAAALHFTNSLDMTITLHDIHCAMILLETAERTMHMALATKARNELTPIGQKIVGHLRKNGKKTLNELLFEFAEEVSKLELQEVLDVLVTTKQLDMKADGAVATYFVKLTKV
jgi:hypothetical protein